jgi:hypothetical protein
LSRLDTLLDLTCNPLITLVYFKWIRGTSYISINYYFKTNLKREFMFLLKKKKEKVNPHFKFVVYCYDDKNKKCYIGEDMEKTSFYDSAKFLTRRDAEDWVELIET